MMLCRQRKISFRSKAVLELLSNPVGKFLINDSKVINFLTHLSLLIPRELKGIFSSLQG